jgi:ubiquinone/menaquinone biosynthesis C-methylase UbiE
VSTDSVSFDRAADSYDKTRSLDPAVWSRVIQTLLSELAGRGRVLEAGVGTGRAALPVHEAGLPVVGIDISEAMMAKARQKSGGRAPLPLVAADAITMPFPDGSFGAAYLIHVLHLIPRWREALVEILRVVRRPGVVLIDPGSGSQRGMSAQLTRRFAREASSSLEKLMPGLYKVEALDAAMSELGATIRMLPEMTITRSRSVRAYVEEMASGSQAFTWQLEEPTRRAAGQRTLVWAAERFGSLDQVRRMRWRIAWRAYDLA